MKAAATTSRQHGEAGHHGRLGLLGRPLIRRHRRGGARKRALSGQSPPCGNRCAYVESTVFGSSPNLAATMWTGTAAVNASVAAVWRSQMSWRPSGWLRYSCDVRFDADHPATTARP